MINNTKQITDLTEEISKLNESKKILDNCLGEKAKDQIDGIDKYISILIDRVNELVKDSLRVYNEDNEELKNKIKEDIIWWNKVLPKLQDKELSKEKESIVEKLEKQLKSL